MEKKELFFLRDSLDKPSLCYTGIPDEVHVFACVAFSIQISFTRVIHGRHAVDRYVSDWKNKRKHFITDEKKK